MTHTCKELLANGVDPEVVAWRRFRRDMDLTIPEAAAMAGCGAHYLGLVEIGQYKMGRRLRTKLHAVMQRWQGHIPGDKTCRS